MDEVQTAVDRYRALETEASDLHRTLLSAGEEMNEIRDEVRDLTVNLNEIKRDGSRHQPTRGKEEQVEKLEAQLAAAQKRLNRAQARKDELSEQFQAARALADNCREFLESGGASIEALEAGVFIPKRRA